MKMHIQLRRLSYILFDFFIKGRDIMYELARLQGFLAELTLASWIKILISNFIHVAHPQK